MEQRHEDDVAAVTHHVLQVRLGDPEPVVPERLDLVVVENAVGVPPVRDGEVLARLQNHRPHVEDGLHRGTVLAERQMHGQGALAHRSIRRDAKRDPERLRALRARDSLLIREERIGHEARDVPHPVLIFHRNARGEVPLRDVSDPPHLYGNALGSFDRALHGESARALVLIADLKRHLRVARANKRQGDLLPWL